MRGDPLPSFTDPETHFELERSDTGPDVDGLWPGEPTGMVVCDDCGKEADCVDNIDHAEECPQRLVHSHYWQVKHPEDVERILGAIDDG